MPSSARSKGQAPGLSFTPVAVVAMATLSLTLVTTARGQSLDLVSGRTVVVNRGSCQSPPVCDFAPRECHDQRVCRLTCTSGRTSTPEPVLPFLEGNRSPTACASFQQPPGLPSHVNSSQGNWFSGSDSSSSGCRVNQAVSPDSATGFFTLSLWLRGDCANSTCPLVRLSETQRDIFNLTVGNNTLSVNEVTNSAWPEVATDSWTHVLVRKSSTTELYVNGTPHTITNFVVPTRGSMDLIFGTVSGNPPIFILDARFYPEALSYREVLKLQRGTLNTAVPFPECFCPASHPKLDSTGFQCLDGSNTGMEKFGVDLHEPEVLVDGNFSTAWASSNSTSSTVQLEVTLAGEYQLDSVNVLLGTSAKPATMTLTARQQNGTWRNISTTSPPTCLGYNCFINVSATQPSDRSGSAVRVTMQPPGSNLVIQELQVLGMCREGYYGNNNNEVCRRCDCEMAGTMGDSTRCDRMDGQCNCKKYVEGRRCDQCKASFWDLDRYEDLGCKPCECNAIGSVSTACNRTTGQCPCRGGLPPNMKCEPVIAGMSPRYGPRYGGTRVTLSGRLLGGQTPGMQLFLVGDSTPLTQTNKSDERIVFIIPPNNSTDTRMLRIDWNNSTQNNMDFTFEYRPDPTVSASAQTALLRSYASGGCKFPVNGANLNSVEFPVVVATAVNYSSISNTMQMCEYQADSGNLQCRTPVLMGSPYNASSLYNLSLDMDSRLFPLSLQVEVVPDPSIMNESQDLIVEFPFSRKITIEGTGLKQACSEQDLRVLVGSKECSILSHTDTQIECEPPDLEGTSGKVLDVKVFLGFSQHEAGRLEYRAFWKTMYFIYIVSGAAALLLIIILIISVRCYCLRRRRKKSESSLELRPNRERNDYSGLSLEGQENGARHRNTYTPLDPSASLPRPRSRTVDTQGFLNSLEHDVRVEVANCLYTPAQFSTGLRCTKKGENFRVIDGEMTEKPIKLTIKAIIEPLPAERTSVPPWALAALREGLRFQGEGGQEGVLGMLGVGLDEQRFYILYPAPHERSLKDHILDSRLEFTQAQLLEFCVQISEAMDYLSTKGVVHRDLAARNCILTEGTRVLVTDGAAGADLYPNEYVFHSNRGRHLPVRWMAPECLSSGFYDTKSDVWSYGVLMWELFTRGSLPYAEAMDSKVESYVLEGFLLAKPDSMPDPLYEFVRKCWHEDGEQRPSFLVVSQSMDPFLKGDRAAIDENFYMNQHEVR